MQLGTAHRRAHAAGLAEGAWRERGHPGRPLGRRDARPLFLPGEQCCDIEGLSLHAKVEIEAPDRDGLERLCRYLARPPIATERRSLAADGRVVYALRRNWTDGTRAFIFDPLDFGLRDGHGHGGHALGATILLRGQVGAGVPGKTVGVLARAAPRRWSLRAALGQGSHPMSEPLWQPRDDSGARLLGAGFFLAGGGVLAWQILGTLRQADEGAPTLSYSIALILLGVMCVAFGALWLVRGLAGYAWVRSMQSDPRARRTLTIAAFVLAAATMALMRWHLARLGYAD